MGSIYDLFDDTEQVDKVLIDIADRRIDLLINKGYIHPNVREGSVKKLYYQLKAKQDSDRSN